MKRFGQKCRWCRNQVNAWLDKFCEGQFLLRPFTQNQISTFLPSSFSKVEHRRWCSATNWQEIVESIDLFLTGVYVGSTGFDLIALFTILVRDVQQRHISQRRSVTFSLVTFFSWKVIESFSQKVYPRKFLLESSSQKVQSRKFSPGGIAARIQAIPSRGLAPI